jgi:hypothetical protein
VATLRAAVCSDETLGIKELFPIPAKVNVFSINTGYLCNYVYTGTLTSVIFSDTVECHHLFVASLVPFPLD